MTTSAWLMLVGTWSVVAFFTAKFFIAVLRKPLEPGAGNGESEEA